MRRDYDKLIRDRIPDIIRAEGSECVVETMPEDAYRTALRQKLVEEAQEAADAPDADLLTELADVAEVLDALLAAHGLTREALAATKAQRREERGGFTRRLRLIAVQSS